MMVAKREVARVVPNPRLDPRWKGWMQRDGEASQPPLPTWLEVIHDYQARVVQEIAAEFAAGARVVFLDAPTGSGKSLIGELVRREMQVARGLYVCSTKSLQEQYTRDFDYARVLKGRANYTPTRMLRGHGGGSGTRRAQLSMIAGARITCADCDKSPPKVPAEDQTCSYCEWVEECPYGVARQGAMRAPVGVLNTSYLLAEANGPGAFSGRDLVVADECDMLEDELLGYVELKVPGKFVAEHGLTVPKKGSHMTTIRAWLETEALVVAEREAKSLGGGGDVERRRAFVRATRLAEDIARVVAREDGWVRDNDEEERNAGRHGPGGLVLKPISVEDLAEKYLWAHGKKWLCMTGTLVSAEMEAESLGLEVEGREIPWATVKAPMLFARENRPVVFAPVALMTRKGQEDGGVGKMLRGVERVCEKHPGVNVLVHTHTYKLAKEVSEHLRRCGTATGGRSVVTYSDSWGRDDALGVFKAAARGEGRMGAKGAILVASSMDRGVDLPGDLCRVQVICKVPMASLGSRQVSERLRSPSGELWYLVKTVRAIMQMCGRAVRGREDHAVTYVLDEHFSKTLKDGKRMGLWPEWWLEGLEVGRVKEYI